MTENGINEIKNKVADLQEVICGFASVLEAENSALKNFDTEMVGQIYEQKVKAVSAYRSMSGFFIKNQECLEVLDAETKSSLAEISKKLDALLQENELLLKTRMETSKNVMNTIINIAKVANNRNATSYGAHGNYSPLDNNKNALALNRTL